MKSTTPHTSPPFIHSLLAVGLLSIPHVSFAQTSTWDGSGATDDWTDGANWGGSAPTAGDLLQFDGSTRLTPNNDYAAGTSFSGLQFLSSAGLFTLGGNAIDLSGDIDSAALGIQTINMDLALTNDIGIHISSADPTSQITFNGGISGAQGLTVSGTESRGWNRVTFNGVNSYTGLTTVGTTGNRVTLWITDPTSLPGAVSVVDGSTLRLRPTTTGAVFSNAISIAGDGAESLNGASWYAKTGGGALVVNNNVDVAGTVTLTANSRISANRDDTSTTGMAGTISGQITGDFDLQFGFEQERAGTVTITNPANDWGGDTYVTGGGATVSSGRIFTLELGGNDVLPSGAGKGDLYIGTHNSRVDTNGNTVNINGLNNSAGTFGNILGGGSFTLGNNDANGLYSGSLTVDTLNKVGTGNQQLAGNTTVTDANVDAGTLTINTGGQLNASGSVNVTGGSLVMDGGDLNYTGATDFNGAITFNSGSLSGTNWNGGLSGLTIGTGVSIAPGNSPGEATTGSQIWADGGSYIFEINDADGTVIVNWDLLTVTGDLDVSGLSTDGFTLALTSLDGSNVAGELPGFDELSNYSWEIASFGTITGTFSSDMINVDTSGFQNTFSGTFAVNQSGNTLTLDYIAVPEPSTYALLISAMAGALVWFRRRK